MHAYQIAVLLQISSTMHSQILRVLLLIKSIPSTMHSQIFPVLLLIKSIPSTDAQALLVFDFDIKWLIKCQLCIIIMWGMLL